jgi:hypothetical protein
MVELRVYVLATIKNKIPLLGTKGIDLKQQIPPPYSAEAAIPVRQVF